jgi:NusA-like KH domain protein
MTVIDIQTMRYINLLDKISKVKTSRCFGYNNAIFFAVDKSLVSKAIGTNASNVRNIQERLGKRVKIISQPQGISDVNQFVKDIISPVEFKSLEIKDNQIIITAGPQNKAALLGRNKRRLDELSLILKDTFKLELKII